MKDPKYEKAGILTGLSKTGGIGGAIKLEPGDFLVEEITPEGMVLELGKNQKFKDKEGEYVHFTLEKTNWDTMRAIKVVSKRLGVSHKRLKFAGTKDRRSISAQRVSVWNVPMEKLVKVRVRDITLRDFSTSDEPVNLGSLKGNRFTIRIDGVGRGADKTVEKIVRELDNKAPNFFGLQRFGSRLNNHVVGKHILMGEFEEAVVSYLCETGDEPEEATLAREALRESRDFKAALMDFPDYLGYEKSVLNHLINEPTDFIGALRRLPKKLRWMFVHAYQAYVFNLALSTYILEGDIPDALPLVGHEMGPDRISGGIMDDEGIKKADFSVSSMPEMSFAGEERKALVDFSGFEIMDFNEKDSNIVVRFGLPPGAYATVVLREIME